MKNSLGYRLKKLREEKEYSQTDLAKIIGTNQSVIWRWEEGTIKTIKERNLGKLCNALSCTHEYLLYGIEKRNGLPEIIEEWLYAPKNRTKVIDFVKNEMINEINSKIDEDINKEESPQ